jgi:hypothetical protein
LLFYGDSRLQPMLVQLLRKNFYFLPCVNEFVDSIVRASGCFDDQSSGGNATRQKLGRASENSNPTSAFPPRTGPRNTT